MASPARAEVSATNLLPPPTIPKLRSPSCASRREWLSDSDLSGSLEQDNHLKSLDLNHVINLLEETESSNSEELLQALRNVVKRYDSGIPLKELTRISKILNLCAERIQDHDDFIEPTCEILKLYRLPFYKKKLSDEVNYANETQESIAQLGYLMRVPCSEVRIQICKSVISFYHAEPPKKEFEGCQPLSANYKRKMVELGGLAETLVLALALVENQLTEKLWIIKTLQHLSTSEANCKFMMKAEAPKRLCSHMNDADVTGQLLFRSSEVLWNLLENASKEEIVTQLSNLECVQLSAVKQITG